MNQDIFEACQLCETIENMVSFTINESPINGDTSVGNRLCLLCKKSAVIAQGVILWARELASGSDFIASASYVTLTPCILGIARLIAKAHRFTRRAVLDLGIIILKHKLASSRERSYQQSQSLKEQCIRLLVWLIALGEAPSTFSSLARVVSEDDSIVDASLIRYFITACLQIICVSDEPTMRKFSISFITTMCNLLCMKQFSDALNSTYFDIKTKVMLNRLLEIFLSTAKTKATKITAKDRLKLLKLKELYNIKSEG